METEITPAHAVSDPPEEARRVSWAGVALFLVLAFGISWLLFIGLRALGLSLTIYAAAGMFGPALAALITRLVRREGFADAGLRLGVKGRKGTWRMYLAAYLVPPLIFLAGIGFALLTTYQHWDLAHNVQGLGKLLAQQMQHLGRKSTPGLTSDQLGWITWYADLAQAFTFALLINSIFTFGEEFGWRGYLLPRLAPLGGVSAAILVGLIWGLWHAPLIVLDGYNYPGHPWLGVLLMMIFCVALSMIFAWLRFRSGSIWTTVLAHAAVNAQAGLALLTLSTGDSLLRAPIGLIGLVPMLAFATFLAVTGRLKPATKTA